MAAQKENLSAAESRRLMTMEKRYREAARARFESRVSYYHRTTGGCYTSITVRDQKSRWGSCSSRGTLSFNYRLIFAPSVILDYVVVHELCHLTHMNHSKDFWDMVASVMPEYMGVSEMAPGARPRTDAGGPHGQERDSPDLGLTSRGFG